MIPVLCNYFISIESETRTFLQVHLAEKASTLPEEPPVGEPGVVTVMVRMPDGSRKARRLRSSDPVQVRLTCLLIGCFAAELNAK